jgi:hypothetical protein
MIRPAANPRFRQGSIILFALAIVAVASLSAYALAVSMRSASATAKDLVISGLSEGAARAGAKHAAEVVYRDYIAYFNNTAGSSRVTSPVGPHLQHFAHTRIRDPLWGYNSHNDYFRRDPGEDQVDNLPIDGNLLLPFGANGASGQAYTLVGNSGHGTQVLSTGSARYIEAGRWRRDGSVVLFSQGLNPAMAISGTVDQPAQSPIWYDKDWRPTTEVSQVRYRIRYAVTMYDLGGTLLWGEQKPFAMPAAGDNSLAKVEDEWIGANRWGNPMEWDMHLAKAYNASFYRMYVAATGTSTEAKMGTWQNLFLGWGGTRATGSNYNDEQAVLGFDSGTGGQPNTNRNQFPGLVGPSKALMTSRSMSMAGGPMSWRSTRDYTSNDSAFSEGTYVTTPFGRAASIRNANYANESDLNLRYYGSQVRTPWRINALTAPAQVHKWMIMGYTPPVVQRNAIKTIPYRTGAGGNDYRTDRYAVEYPVPGRVYGYQISSNLHARIPPSGSPTNQPFAGYTSPDFTQNDTFPPAAAYTTAYPDLPEFWEEYAHIESKSRTFTPVPTGPTSGNGSSGTPHLWDYNNDYSDRLTDRRSRMLGWHINTYNPRRNNLTPSTVALVEDSTYHRNYYMGYSMGTGELGWLNGWNNNTAVEDGSFTRRNGGSQPQEPLRGMSGDLMRSYPGTTTLRDRAEGDSYDVGAMFFHADSYWLDLAAAMANAIVIAKAQYLDAGSVGADFATALSATHDASVPPLAATSPLLTRPNTVKQLDRLFLAALGEHFFQDYIGGAYPSAATLETPVTGLAARRIRLDDKAGKRAAITARYGSDYINAKGDHRRRETFFGTEFKYMQASSNIAGMKRRLLYKSGDTEYGTWANGPQLNPDDPAHLMRVRRKLANMELVLNDMRMSFFGANPDYSPRPIKFDNGVTDPPSPWNPVVDEFRPYDFDGDGYALCSCYTDKIPLPAVTWPGSRSIPIMPTAAGDSPPDILDLRDAVGRRYPASPAPAGYGATPDFYFSLTGYYVMEKARFWRVISRGEVWDELLRKPISEATFENAFCIDPEGSLWTKHRTNHLKNDRGVSLTVPTTFTDQIESATLYQRWVTNFARGTMPLTQ